MTEITLVYIALGSNLGDRDGHLHSALECLRNMDGINVTKVSSFIETEPEGPIHQGRYLNAAAELETNMSARILLDIFHGIEKNHGRDRSNEVRWGPRTLDIDLLLYGDDIIDEPGLQVPHPRMAGRHFVLEPLVEIAHDVLHPVTQKSVGLLLMHVQAEAAKL